MRRQNNSSRTDLPAPSDAGIANDVTAEAHIPRRAYQGTPSGESATSEFSATADASPDTASDTESSSPSADENAPQTGLPRWTRLVLYSAVFLLAVVLFGLIAMLYRADTALKTTQESRILSDADRESRALGYFLSGQMRNLEELAGSPAFSAYYQNLWLGMSLKYGLGVSITLMEKQLTRFLDARTLTGVPVFDQTGFVDTKGRLFLSRTPTAATGTALPDEQLKALVSKTATSTTIGLSDEAPTHLVITVPYLYDDRLLGHLVATIPLATLSRYLGLIVADAHHASYLSNGSTHTPPLITTAQIASCCPPVSPPLVPGSVHSVTLTDADNVDSLSALGVRSHIPGTPFSLIAVYPRNFMQTGQLPTSSMLLLAAIAAVTLLTALLAARLDSRNASLHVRLAEAAKRRRYMDRQNALLQDEIEERKQALAALARAEEKYRSIVENAPEGIYQSTEEGAFLSLNPAMVDIFGYADSAEMRDALNGRMERLYLHSDTRDSFVRDLLDRGSIQRFVTQALTKHGERIWIMESARTLTLPDGNSIFEGFIRDITAQKEAENALIAARDSAEAANRAKSEFLANISHEIRTPMNAIVGIAELSIHTEKSPLRRKNMTVLHDAATDLLKLLNELLDFARVESGNLSLDIRPFKVAEVLERVCFLMTAQAERKSLRLSMQSSPAVPEWLHGDADRIRQILLNLVGNAVKFTDSGSVTVTCTVEESGIDVSSAHAPIPVSLCFTVADTGIGIPASKLESIFQSFTQVDGSATRKHGGAGLGLAISRSLAETMGGAITVESLEGKGATFFLRLPLPVATAPLNAPLNFPDDTPEGTPVGTSECAPLSVPVSHTIPGAEAEQPLVRGLRVLVAEDNPFNQTVIRQMLEVDNHTVTVVADGSQALAKLEKEPFDTVLMDIQMPVLDGLATTRALRALPENKRGQSPSIPVIALSAHIRPGESQTDCLKAGVDSCLAKPVSLRDLRSALRALFPEKTTPTSLPASPVPSPVSLNSDRPETPASPAVPFADFRVIYARMAGKRHVIAALLDAYSQTMPETFRQIEQGLADDGMEEVQRLAHSVKSNLRTIGANGLAEHMVQIEDAARALLRDKAARLFAAVRSDLTQTVQETGTMLASLDALMTEAVSDSVSDGPEKNAETEN